MSFEKNLGFNSTKSPMQLEICNRHFLCLSVNFGRNERTKLTPTSVRLHALRLFSHLMLKRAFFKNKCIGNK
jgi:hypothetical protein